MCALSNVHARACAQIYMHKLGGVHCVVLEQSDVTIQRANQTLTNFVGGARVRERVCVYVCVCVWVSGWMYVVLCVGRGGG